MKKLLSFLGISTIVAASAMTLVSCGFHGERYSGIYVITDTGKIADRSFNQSGYESGNRFVQDALLMENAEVSYAQPTVMTDAPWMYSQSYKNDAKALVLPGFKHLNYLESADKGAELVDGAAIIVDASGMGLKSTIGLLYRADMSGFWAGIASIMHVLKITNDQPLLATYGGMQNATAGDPFMAGFLASVKVFNDSYAAYAKGETQRSPQEKNVVLGFEKIAKSFLGDDFMKVINRRTANIVGAQTNGYNGGNHSQWFTDSYDPGKGSDISQVLINTEKANIIMPVAGPQTADTLNILSENKYQNKKFIVGVDTDQVTMYDTFADFFITSAEKDIIGSTALALAHSEAFDEEMDEAKEVLEAKGKDYNEVLNEMGNKLPVTYEITPGNFEEVYYGLGEEGSVIEGKHVINDWKGKDLWLGGSISTGGENEVDSTQFDVIKEVLGEGTQQASLDYFKYVTAPGQNTANFTLSKIAFDNYADKVLEYMSMGTREINYGEFLNYGK